MRKKLNVKSLSICEYLNILFSQKKLNKTRKDVQYRILPSGKVWIKVTLSKTGLRIRCFDCQLVGERCYILKNRVLAELFILEERNICWSPNISREEPILVLFHTNKREQLQDLRVVGDVNVCLGIKKGKQFFVWKADYRKENISMSRKMQKQ